MEADCLLLTEHLSYGETHTLRPGPVITHRQVSGEGSYLAGAANVQEETGWDWKRRGMQGGALSHGGEAASRAVG